MMLARKMTEEITTSVEKEQTLEEISKKLDELIAVPEATKSKKKRFSLPPKSEKKPPMPSKSGKV